MIRRPVTALGMSMGLQVVAAAIFTATAVIAPALPPSLGLDRSGLGIFGALTFAGATLGSPVAAAYMARFGPVRLIQAGLVFSALSLAILYTEIGFLGFAAAILIGLGYGPNAPGGSYMLARHTPPDRRGLIFSIKQAGVPAGGVLIGIVIPLVEANHGWRAAIAVVIATGVATALLAQPWRGRMDDDRVRPAAGSRVRIGDMFPLRALSEHPMLPLIAMMSFAYGCGQMIVMTYTVTFLVEEVHLDLVAAGAAFSAAQISSFVVRIASGWLNDRLRRPRAMLSSFGIVACIGLGSLSFAGPETSYAMIVVLAAICGAGAAGWNGVYLAEVAAMVPPDRVAAATAATVSCTYFGLVVGPAAFSVILAVWDFSTAYAGLAVFAGLAGLIIFLPLGGRDSAGQAER
ncbi:MAG: MFS transporter [Pseudomonadota bacterium]|nr:MFS transporter [Pseudomonadota bacterium]